jgi:hypothetical protein
MCGFVYGKYVCFYLLQIRQVLSLSYTNCEGLQIGYIIEGELMAKLWVLELEVFFSFLMLNVVWCNEVCSH